MSDTVEPSDEEQLTALVNGFENLAEALVRADPKLAEFVAGHRAAVAAADGPEAAWRILSSAARKLYAVDRPGAEDLESVMAEMGGDADLVGVVGAFEGAYVSRAIADARTGDAAHKPRRAPLAPDNKKPRQP